MATAADPAVPGQPGEAVAAMYGYLRRVLVDGEVPAECPAAAGVAMAHLIAEGMASEFVAAGMTPRRASAEVRARVAERARQAAGG